MEDLIRGCLKWRLGIPRPRIPEGSSECRCGNFLVDCAYNYRQLSEWPTACQAREHECMCRPNRVGPYLGVLMEGCLAKNHYCTCYEPVLPTPNMNWGCNGFMPGHLLCKSSEDHDCICVRYYPSICKSSRHACTCGCGTDSCRGTKHHCQCDRPWRTHAMPCRVHPELYPSKTGPQLASYCRGM